MGLSWAIASVRGLTLTVIGSINRDSAFIPNDARKLDEVRASPVALKESTATLYIPNGCGPDSLQE